MLEITLRPRLDAIGADPRLGDVQIDFHDPPFAPDRLDQKSEPHLGHLAHIARPAAPLPQEDIFRGLLAYRLSAAQFLSLRLSFDRLFDRLAVSTLLAANFAIGRTHVLHPLTNAQ